MIKGCKALGFGDKYNKGIVKLMKKFSSLKTNL